MVIFHWALCADGSRNLSLLQRFFKKAARNNHFPPPPADGPPQPEGSWSLIVDENGDRVTNRKPRETDFLARLPVPYIDGGTHPPYEKDPRLKEEENLQNLVSYEIRTQKNREHLKKAVFLLSQTDDGRRLLHKAQELKFTIVFDPALCAEEKAVGLMDYNQKKIPLAEGRSPAEVALTLKHELQHMEDVSKGLSYGLEDTPKGAQLANRALEGNARVSEAVAAAEALMGSPQGPARQFRTAALFNNLWHKNPEIAESAHDAMEDAAGGKWAQYAAKILPAYFTQESTLAYYDERYARFIDKYVPDVTSSKQALEKGDYRHHETHKRRIETTKANADRLFTLDRWAPEKVAELLTIRNLPYMNEMKGKGFSLADDAAIALTTGAPKLFEKLKQNILGVLPDSAKPQQLDLPVMQQKKGGGPGPSPYAAFRTANEEEEFSPVRLPDRIDGSMLTSGERSNELTTKLFKIEMDSAKKSGGTETDHVNYAVGMYLHRQRGIANLRGLVSDLVEAGLRAPIGAFPDDYLHDLYGRMALSVRHGGKGIGISPEELTLVDHWQQMKDKGMDPVWINDKNKSASWVADDKQILFYAKYLEAP